MNPVRCRLRLTANTRTSDISKTKSKPLKPEFIRLRRNKAARKYHKEFAVVNFEEWCRPRRSQLATYEMRATNISRRIPPKVPTFQKPEALSRARSPICFRFFLGGARSIWLYYGQRDAHRCTKIWLLKTAPFLRRSKRVEV